jgi:hypothetical protein
MCEQALRARASQKHDESFLSAFLSLNTERKTLSMMHRFAAGASLAAVLLVSSTFAEDKPIKSGLQVGDSPKAFNPLHCNGKNVGKKNCLV